MKLSMKGNPAFFLLLLLFSCQQEAFEGEGSLPGTGTDTDVHGDIRFEISLGSPTRVATASDFRSTWETDDEIGLFAVRRASASSATLAASGNYIHNVKLTYNSANGGSWTPAESLYFPVGGDVLDFYAYYPYDANSGSPASLNPLAMTVGAPTDLLHATANNSGAGYGKGSTVTLSFAHAFSLIQVEVPCEGRGFGPSENLTVRLRNVKTKAVLNLGNASGPEVTLATTGNNPTVVDMARVEQPTDANYTTSYTYRAHVPTQTLAAGNPLFWFEHEERQLLSSDALTASLTLAGGRAERYTIPLPMRETLHTVLVRKGTFQMGQEGISDAVPVHEVTLTKDFYMGKYEVTTAQYCAFLNANKDVFTVTNAGASAEVKGTLPTIGSFNDGDYIKATDKDGDKVLLARVSAETITYNDGLWSAVSGYENHPMTNVTWYGAFAFAQWLGGRLPTEAEWEYACRAGTTTPWSFGDTDANIGDYAWYSGNNTNDGYPYGAKPIGLKLPNPWGLYDIHGNVYEWCYDWYATYTASGATDPVNITAAFFRVLRGGAFTNTAASCRSAFRYYIVPAGVSISIGFRVVFPL